MRKQWVLRSFSTTSGPDITLSSKRTPCVIYPNVAQRIPAQSIPLALAAISGQEHGSQTGKMKRELTASVLIFKRPLGDNDGADGHDAEQERKKSYRIFSTRILLALFKAVVTSCSAIKYVFLRVRTPTYGSRRLTFLAMRDGAIRKSR